MHLGPLYSIVAPGILLQLHPFSFFPHKLSLLFVVFVLFVAVFHKFIPFLVYIKLSLIFVVFVLFVAVFLYSTMVKSLRPFLEEATSLVLFCHLLGFSDPTGLPSPKKKSETKCMYIPPTSFYRLPEELLTIPLCGTITSQ